VDAVWTATRLASANGAGAMANFLWTAFIADNGSNDILVASSDGTSWTPSVAINQTSPFTPSLALFKGTLYVAFITNDVDSATGVPSNRIFISSTDDGVSWSSAQFFNQYSKCAPSLAVWNDRLHVAFVANDPSNAILVYSTADPDAKPWTATTAVKQTTASTPSLAAFGRKGETGQLYLAFAADNGSNDIFVCSLGAEGPWSPATVTGQSCHFSPSLAVFNHTLFVAFAAANGSRDLLVSWLNPNGTWSGAAPVNQSSSASPSAVAFGNDLCLGFVANNSGGEILMTSASNPVASWPSTNVDLKQSSAAGPSFAQAPFACCWELVKADHRQLVGNSNYFLWGGTCAPPVPNVLKLKLVIEIGSDLVCGQAYHPKNPNAKATQGFDFQLNCYPPVGDTASRWQQYVFSFQPDYTDGTIPPTPTITCSVEFFGTSGFNAHLPGYFPVASAASARGGAATPQTIPAGYVFTIELTNDPVGNVINAAFTVVDNNGNKKNWSLPIGPTGAPIVGAKSSPFTANGQFVFGPSAAAPIISFQLNIAGVNGSAFVPFTSGQGAITYTASNLMYVDDRQPPCSASQRGLTGESSNCAYSLLPVGPSRTFVQPFFPQPS
jgi:hypothetical protein